MNLLILNGFQGGNTVKKTKFIAIGLVMLMIFVTLMGCAGDKYNTELFDATQLLKAEFINDNPISDIYNGTYPTSRTFIIDNQEKYNQMFNESAQLNINFDTHMIVTYTFYSIYRRDNKLVNVEVDDKTLFITYEKEKKEGVGDACAPYQQWLAVKLEKVEVEIVVFEEKK